MFLFLPLPPLSPPTRGKSGYMMTNFDFPRGQNNVFVKQALKVIGYSAFQWGKRVLDRPYIHTFRHESICSLTNDTVQEALFALKSLMFDGAQELVESYSYPLRSLLYTIFSSLVCYSVSKISHFLQEGQEL